MFFPVSKVLGFFASPSNLIVVAGLVGLVLLMTRWKRTASSLALGSLILLAVLGLSPIGNDLIIPLEDRFPPWDPSRGAPDGIIVLGGVISPDISVARNEVILNEAAERLTVVADLARRYPAARIVFSGGTGALLADEPCASSKASGLRASAS